MKALAANQSSYAASLWSAPSFLRIAIPSWRAIGIQYRPEPEEPPASLSREEIVPVDNEGSYLLKKVPVIWEEFASGTPEMARKVAEALRSYKIIMLRGHGSFATGQTLEEAFFWSSALEEVSQIILYTLQINEPLIEYRKMTDSYSKW